MIRKNKFTMMFLLISSLVHAGNLINFGDSLSDTGNLARFTYNSGKIYNENLADYLGEDFEVPDGGSSTLFGGIGTATPPSLKGPNFAQGGATANEDLGIGNSFFSASFIKFQTGKQIKKFFDLNKDKENFKNLKVIYWIGGNDMRLISEISNKENREKTFNKSIEDIGSQIKNLADNGINFLIIPTVPDIGYTPKFFKEFSQNVKIDNKVLFIKKNEGLFSWFISNSGLKIEELDALLDEPSKNISKLDEVIRCSIREILKKQNRDFSEKIVNKWFEKYKSEREKISKLGSDFNLGVDKKIEELKKQNSNISILRPDTSALIKEVMSNPEYYGFTNITGSASKTFSSVLFSNLGKGSGRDRISAFEPEDKEDGKGGLEKKHLWNKGYHYLFGDEFHPSPEAHKIISDYIIALLETEGEKIKDESILYNYKISKDQNSIANISAVEKKYKTSNIFYEKGYVPFGVIKAKNGGKINWEDLNLKNDGIAIAAKDKNTVVKIKNYRIENRGRISSTIQVENAAKVIMEDGILNSKRGSRISYSFGARINGKDSNLVLKNSKLLMNGKQSVGISVGNRGNVDIISSEIAMKDEKNKGLHIWNSTANLKDSKINSEIGAWIFSNANGDQSILKLENSKINSVDYAIKISPNITKNTVFGNIISNNSEINGGIFTAKNSTSNINFNNSLWNMTKDSSLTNLNLNNSQINFSSNDNKNDFNTLTVNGNYNSLNAILNMKGRLERNNSTTDLLLIKGNVKGNTFIDYKNLSTESVTGNYGIKIVDLKKSAKKDTFKLLKPVYSGTYEYILFGKEDEQDKIKKFYLTSILNYKNGKKYIPIEKIKTSLDRKNLLLNENLSSIRLFRPKVSVASLAPYANMESNFENIFHIKDRDNLYFTIENVKKELKEENQNKIDIKNNITKLSYPLNKNYGLLFSIGQSNIKLYDITREQFNKNSYVGSLNRKDYNIGIYFQHSFAEKLYFDHTLQYEWIFNKYKAEEEIYKKNGRGIALSSLAYSPIKLNENLKINPYYQIDFFQQNFNSYKNNAIRNHFGLDIVLKAERVSILVGVKYQENLKNIKNITVKNQDFKHIYKNNTILYKLEGEFKILEPLKIFANVNFNKDKNTSYKLGIKYKF